MIKKYLLIYFYQFEKKKISLIRNDDFSIELIKKHKKFKSIYFKLI